MYRIIFIISLIVCSQQAFAQSPADSTQKFTLEECIDYAAKNQPLFQQAILDREIANRDRNASLSSWAPQVRAEYNATHWFALPVTFIPNFTDPSLPRSPARLGLPNTSNLLVQAEQTIFNKEVILGAKAAKNSVLGAQQNITNNKIILVNSVSKAFYDVLVTQKQLSIIDEDISRQEKLYKDAHSLFENGVADKVDYRRTTISLNNVKSQKKRTQESLKYKNIYLKQLMGYPTNKGLVLAFDTLAMKQEAIVDTNQTVDYNKRIEFQQLKTQMELQSLTLKYYEYGYLPTVSGFVNYNLLWQAQNLSNLYSKEYPNSAVGIRASMPLFTGTRRYQNVQKSKLQIKRMQLSMDWFKEQVQTEFSQAMGSYKSNLNDLKVQEENLGIAKEVYGIIKLQYDNGIKSYLDVITSETDLRTSELNYLNSLYNVLSSKLDVQRAMGNINNNPQ